MSNENDVSTAEAIFWLLFILFVVYITVWIAGIVIVAGTIFGGGVSLYNYGVAFKNNVKLEKPTI